MGQLDYFGVHPGCGCISAWMSGDYCTTAEIRKFYRDMANSGRDVRRMELTEELRHRINRCVHEERVDPGQLIFSGGIGSWATAKQP